MKKYIESVMMLLVGMLVVTACNNKDDDYNWTSSAGSLGEQVYFSADLAASIDTPVSASSFKVQLNRVKTDTEQTVPLKITAPEDCIYTPASDKVTFAQGSKTAELVFNYDPAKVQYGKYVDITVEIADASFTTPYGSSKYTFQVGMTEWKKMTGKATFKDDLVCGLYGATTAWAVEIEESVVTPGRYRLVAPYGPNSGFPSFLYKNGLIEGSSLDAVKSAYKDTNENTYLIVNAQDPKAVYIEECETGYSDLGGGISAGAVGVISYPYYYIKAGKFTFEEYKAKYPEDFGILEDGVITFPSGKEILVTIDGALKYYGNTHKEFAIALPGHSLKDLTAELTFKGIFTNAAGEVFANCDLTLGADATNVKAIVMEQDVDDEAVADAIAAGELEAMDVTAGNINVPISADMTGKLKVIVVVIDNGAAKTIKSADFEYYGGGKNPWQSLGTGYLTDDFVVTMFYETYDEATETGTVYEPKTYEVEILENTDEPGAYRIVDAFKGVTSYLKSLTYESANLDVNATNPDAVYIETQSTGLFDGSDEIAIASYGGYSGNVNYMGKLVDGVITFPVLQTSSGTILQGIVFFGTSGYYTGSNGAFKIVLPSASAGVKAKAKRAAAAADFEHRLNGGNVHRVKGVHVKKSSLQNRFSERPQTLKK